MRLAAPLLAISLAAFVALFAVGCTSASSPGMVPAERAIVNKGSDTMVNLALAWAEAYQQVEPAISVSVTGGGSGTGIAALINGTGDRANASRQIKPEETEEARANGIEAEEIVVARDAIAVIVHRDNPVDHLTIEQISAIYGGQINNWPEGGGAGRPLVRPPRRAHTRAPLSIPE